MKTYNSNFKSWYTLFFILLIYFLSSFILDFKLNGFFVYVCVVLSIILLAHFIEKRIVKIILDDRKNEITVVQTSMFNLKRNFFSCSIDEVNCYFYKKLRSKGGYSMCFKIEMNLNVLFDFRLDVDGWSEEDLEDLIKEINRLK